MLVTFSADCCVVSLLLCYRFCAVAQDVEGVVLQQPISGMGECKRTEVHSSFSGVGLTDRMCEVSTCLVCVGTGRVSEASQSPVERALTHAVDGGEVTLTERLLTPITVIYQIRKEKMGRPLISTDTEPEGPLSVRSLVEQLQDKGTWASHIKYGMTHIHHGK